MAFFAYLAASIMYVAGFIGTGIRRPVSAAAGGGAAPAGAGAADGAAAAPGTAWYQRGGGWAYWILTLGNVAQGAAIALRGLGAGYWPTANMFEFISAMGFATMLAFQIMIIIFRLPALGALVAPLGLIILGYASVFPKDVKPLIPPLKSYWLHLHVSLAALGEGFFAVAFGAALLYLLRTRGEEGESRWGGLALEGLFWFIATIIAFVVLALALRGSGLQWSFPTASGDPILYHLPPVIGPNGAAAGSQGSLLGIPLPLFQGPLWMKARNANTFLWTLAAGTALYWAVRGLAGRPLRVALAGPARGLSAPLLDEISYRAVAIGYPVFTLGGLVFAMIWAKEAWGRYWFWDPKETWALITWLTYSGYLHARITHGWEGRKSAWLAVAGFGVVLFTLVGVNLLIVGLHSYAGGD